MCVCVTQGPWAETMMHSAMEKGHWVFFQNCHLAPSWMPSLERLIENISPSKVRTEAYTGKDTNRKHKNRFLKTDQLTKHTEL